MTVHDTNQVGDEMVAARHELEAEMNRPLEEFEVLLFNAGYLAASKNALGWMKKEAAP